MFDTEGLDYVPKAFTCICSTKLLSCILFDKHIIENLILSDELKSRHLNCVTLVTQLPILPRKQLIDISFDIRYQIKLHMTSLCVNGGYTTQLRQQFGHTDFPIAILVAYFCQLPLGPKGKLFEGMKEFAKQTSNKIYLSNEGITYSILL